jgi:hypothetical protein
MLMLSDNKTSPGAVTTQIYIGDLEREQIVRTLNFDRDGAEVPQVSGNTAAGEAGTPASDA